MPLTFLETLLDWKAAVDDVLVAVVGLWALVSSGRMVVVLLRRSSALQWAVAAAEDGASPPLFSLLSEKQSPCSCFFYLACLPALLLDLLALPCTALH